MNVYIPILEKLLLVFPDGLIRDVVRDPARIYAPETGLAVVMGTNVAVRLETSPAMVQSPLVEWRTAKRKTKTGYDPWITRHTGSKSVALAMNEAGIFALAARVVCGSQSNEVIYVHTHDEPHIEAILDRCGPNKAGEWNHIGVASTEGLLRLRNTALRHLGTAEYRVKDILMPRNGFSLARSKTYKCNLFVADVAIEAGFQVPVGRIVPHTGFPDGQFPPFANDWALGNVTNGWSYLGRNTYPEPGFIAGHPHRGGMGHVGIVDYDGWTISAREYGISRMSVNMLDGTCGYSKPKEEPE